MQLQGLVPSPKENAHLENLPKNLVSSLVLE